MNLANKLTMSRIALTFVFMFFLFSGGIAAKVTAFVVFSIASLTDMLDGLVAKGTKSVTDFGKLMDPIADKILVLAAFVAFVEMKIIPGWMVVVITLREFLITGLRVLALTKGRVISASEGGRHKTVSQFAAIFVILLFVVVREMSEKGIVLWFSGMESAYRGVIYLFMLVTVILTTISGVSYLIRNKEVYLNAKAG